MEIFVLFTHPPSLLGEIFTRLQYSARPQGANVLTGKMPKDLSAPSKCCNRVIHNYCA